MQTMKLPDKDRKTLVLVVMFQAQNPKHKQLKLNKWLSTEVQSYA